MLFNKVKAKSSEGAVSNQDLPFDGPSKVLHLVALGMQGPQIHPSTHPSRLFSGLDDKQSNLFPFLYSKSE